MKIKITQSFISETTRYLYIYWNILYKNYDNTKLFIVPYLPHRDPSINRQLIILPHSLAKLFLLLEPYKEKVLSFNEFKSYEDFAQNIEKNILCFKHFKILNTFLIPDLKIKKLNEKWKLLQGEFQKLLKNIIDDSTGFEHLNIEVRITSIGTSYSYHKIDTTKFIIYLRKDMPVRYIIKIILMIYARKTLGLLSDTNNQFKSLAFYSAHAISNFLLTETKLKKLFPDFEPYPQKIDIPKEIVDMSYNYTKNLGILLEPKDLLIKDNDIFFQGKPITIFSKQEHELISNFIKNREKLLTLDDIAKILWKDKYLEKYSLSAINKIIHNLRFKMRSLGIILPYIRTVKGRGYVLK